MTKTVRRPDTVSHPANSPHPMCYMRSKRGPQVYFGPIGLSRAAYRPPPGPVQSRKTDWTGVPKSVCHPHGLVKGARMSTVRNTYEILWPCTQKIPRMSIYRPYVSHHNIAQEADFVRTSNAWLYNSTVPEPPVGLRWPRHQPSWHTFRYIKKSTSCLETERVTKTRRDGEREISPKQWK